MLKARHVTWPQISTTKQNHLKIKLKWIQQQDEQKYLHKILHAACVEPGR